MKLQNSVDKLVQDKRNDPEDDIQSDEEGHSQGIASHTCIKCGVTGHMEVQCNWRSGKSGCNRCKLHEHHHRLHDVTDRVMQLKIVNKYGIQPFAHFY